MTIQDILELVESGEITNLDTEIVIDCGNNRYYKVCYWDLIERGLSGEEIYQQIDAENSILVLG